MGESLYICIMNYKQIHDSIIDRAKTRVLPKEVYTERHHIIPRCMGGSDDKSNLVDLTAKEHFIVHKLLVEINPNIYGLVLAVIFMMKGKSGNQNRGYKFSSREYQRVRELCSKLQSELTKGEKAYWYGREKSLEMREKISNTLKGRPNPNMIGIKNPMNNPDTVEKMRQKHLGKVLSTEHKQKISDKLKGDNAYWYGKKHNEDSKLKMSESKKGSKSPTAKCVMNINTGVFYDTIAEASEIYGIKYDNLKYWLNSNSKKNNTGLVLV